jgi:hypothetical protein
MKQLVVAAVLVATLAAPLASWALTSCERAEKYGGNCLACNLQCWWDMYTRWI